MSFIHSRRVLTSASTLAVGVGFPHVFLSRSHERRHRLPFVSALNKALRFPRSSSMLFEIALSSIVTGPMSTRESSKTEVELCAHFLESRLILFIFRLQFICLADCVQLGFGT